MKIYNPEFSYEITTLINENTDLYSGPKKDVKIFLAGTIDEGKSNNWQNYIIEILGTLYDSSHITVFNPRRNIWAYDCDIHKQIEWEQKKLDEADHIFMILEESSKSPISLLELGLYAKSKKITVFCTENFYRFENVEETCKKHGITLITDFIKSETCFTYTYIANCIIDVLKNREKSHKKK